jgi:vacuolar protein sorting-associated protein 13A/C
MIRYIAKCQEQSIFSLSPQKPLIVDNERFDHFAYDGKGGKLYLLDRGGKILSSPSSKCFIHVLGRKRLQFRNVTIVVMLLAICGSCFLLSALRS